MTWFPIGPDFVRDPRTDDPLRAARRNLWGAQGRINCIAFEPVSGTGAPVTTYVVVRDSMQLAAFRRGAADAAWQPITDPLRRADSNVDPFWLAVSPHAPATVYMGTFNDRGIYVSTTRGDAWAPKIPIAGRVRKLLVDPRPPATPAQTVLYAATDSGVHRSADNGASWAVVLPGDVWSLSFRVDAAGTPHFWAGLYQSGVWYADSDPLAAASWTHLNALGIGLPAHAAGTATTPENFHAVLVDCCAANPSRAYAWFVGPTGASSPTPAETVGLYTTGSPRTVWTLVNPLPALPWAGGLEPLHPMQGFDNFVFAVAPDSPGDGAADILFFGNIGNARSIDGGVSWQPVRQFFHNDMHGFAFYPERPAAGARSDFYIGSDGGLGKHVKATDPSFAVETDLPLADNNAGEVVSPSSGTFVNLNDGLQNSLVYVVGGDPGGVAPPYLGCVDTGLNVKDGGLGWRSFGSGDSFELAVALGSDGVKVWEKVHLGSRRGIIVGTDSGGFALAAGALANLAGEPDSGVMPTSPFVADGTGQCLAGCLIEETVTATTDLVPEGVNVVVQVASTAEIPEGQYLAIGIGADRQAATAVNVTPTSFEVRRIYSAKPVGSPVRLIRPAVVRIDQSGVARRISQRFASGLAESVRNLGFNPAAAVRKIVCTTGLRRLWRVDESATLGGPATWQEITTGSPAGITISALAVGRNGDLLVLAREAWDTGAGFVTPLFRVAAAGSAWEPLRCGGLPTTAFADGSPQPFGRLVADPVQDDVLYAIHGAEVYRIRREGAGAAALRQWSPVASGLPGCWVSDLWVGDLADPGASERKVVLRAGVLGRGVWEADVTAGAAEPPVDLFVRRHLLDQGWLTQLRDGLPNPYDPTRRVWHYQCADLKIDAPRSAAGGTFYQTDPWASGVAYSAPGTPAGPIANTLFDQLRDDSQQAPEATALRVHAQVQNRSAAPLDGVRVWVLFTPVAAGVPALGSRTVGSSFSFWSQFRADGTIVPALPGNSWWQAVGSPVTLDGLDAAHPKVASWSWTAPALAPGDRGHYCMAIFVHSAASPVGESARTSIDEITGSNKQVGQKNLTIIEVGTGGTGGSGGSGGAGMGAPGMGMAMRGPGAVVSDLGASDLAAVDQEVPLPPTYVWFHNPTAEVRTARLVFDLARLPADMEVGLRFTRLVTARPLEESLVGVARVERPGCRGWIADWLGRPLQFLRRLLRRLLSGPAVLARLPRLEPTRYVAGPATAVEVTDVRLGPFAAVAAALDLRPAKAPAAGEELRFDVQQVVGRQVVGGVTFVLRAPPAAKPVAIPRPSQREFAEMERTTREDPTTYLPPWIRRIREAQR